jgi:ABC-type Mn2+/Zn2+ transport system ATPase subunit
METPNDYILKVENLSLEFPNQIILDNVSFRLKRGTTLAIIGPNGAGKTMLFRALLNLVPYKGKIEWANKVKIGYVPQNLSVSDVPISVKEFLSIKNVSNIENSLSSVGLNSKDVLNKRLGALSGGQVRRVLIAWAVIDNPNVLLFDEATAGVDVDSEEAIYRMLNQLEEKNKITMLLISHDIHIIREYSDYMMALNKCVTFFGESKQIMDPSLQTMIYGAPVCMETEGFR